MKTASRVFLSIFVLLTVSLSFAQQGEWCGFDPILEEKVQENPNYMDELKQRILDIRQAGNAQSEKAATYTIPVVFHIIHDGGEGNISMDQIQSGIDVMNEDFAALNTDATQIRNTTDAPYAPLHADIEVEFKLAKIDPDGNCTNGVERKFAPNLTNDAGEACKYSANGGLDAWPNDSYLNIWVVNSIEGSGGGTTLGYAFLPYNNWGAGHGILNRHDRIGRIGTAEFNDGRTLTHEMGHICGLLHTFQDGCHSSDCESSGDYICDTPPTEQVFGCLPSNNSCNDVPVNDPFGFDVLDQNENHMSYNTCRRMFTEGQKALMHNNFENISNFVSLTSAANLVATGVNEPDVMCKAEFYADQEVICVGETINFTDASYHGAVGWDWDFPGGTPSTSTDQNPSIVYNTPGTYEVTLTATDGNNQDIETKTAFVRVLSNAQPLPFYEDFENVSSIPDDFWVVKNNGSDQAFEIKNVGLSGTKSAGISNFGQPVGGIDELISSPIDLSGITDEVTLSFRYAYKKRFSVNEEWLRVFLSNDCGDIWAQRKTLKGNQLGENVDGNSWEPTSDNDWVTVHMTNVTSSFWVDNFRVKFQFEGDNGNNFYLDDINIYQGSPSDDPVLNLNENNSFTGFNVYPNPARDNINVEFATQMADQFVVDLMTIDGKVVQHKLIQANSGNNLIVLDGAGLSGGVYFVRVGSKGSAAKQVKRLIIQ